MRYINIVDLTY